VRSYERLAPAHLHPIDGRGSMPNDTRRDRPLYEEIEWTEEDEAAADRALERLIAEEQPALDENGEDDLDRLWRERGLLHE